MGSIYGLIDPRNQELRYVGKAEDPILRIRQHVLRADREKTHRASWIRKLQANGLTPELVILERDPVGGLNVAEIAWIAYARSMGCRLTNLTDGGDGGVTISSHRRCVAGCTCGKHRTKGLPRSPETVEKVAQATRRVWLGRKHTLEAREKMSRAKRGCTTWNKGRRCSPDCLCHAHRRTRSTNGTS